jgi:hypothetical protein
MSERKINLHVELITGFQQDESYVTGLESLSMRLQEFASPTVKIKLTEYDHNRVKEVKRIDRMCSPDCQFIVAAYSWGVGCGAVQFAKELQKRGRYINRLFSIDGVYHNKYMPWRAMWGPITDRILGEPTIWLPSNVMMVDMWRQTMNKPCGHPVKVMHPTRRVEHPVRVVDHGVLMRNHESMDEANSIHEEVYKCVQSYVNAS